MPAESSANVTPPAVLTAVAAANVLEVNEVASFLLPRYAITAPELKTTNWGMLFWSIAIDTELSLVIDPTFSI